MGLGIRTWGAYIPRRRLERSAIATAHQWLAPSLKSMAKGARAYCNWDEDAVTMAVEAGRTCLRGRPLGDTAALHIATTTAPFADLQASAIVLTALRLPRETATLDVTGSHRAGISALRNACVHGARRTLVIASDRPRAKPASPQEMQYGAGAAAFLIDDEEVAAELIGTASGTTMFVDHFRGANAAHDYYWEERWIRDEGYMKLGVSAVRAALANAGIGTDQVDHFIFAAPVASAAGAVAKAAGIDASCVADGLDQQCGFTGAAHPLLMLANVLDRAEPGQHIVACGFAQGGETVVFRATDRIAHARPENTVAKQLAAGIIGGDYLRLAAFYGEIHCDLGMRAERDTKTALTEQYRSAEQVLGFVAGRCPSCQTVQFPQLSYCVECRAPAKDFEPICLAEEPAKVQTFTADGLMFHPSPPLYVGFAQFDNGARLLMEFVDVDPQTFDVGTPLSMCFRIKERDEQRGYDRYFWKAAPLA